MASSARVEVAPLGIKLPHVPLARRSRESGTLRLGFFGTVAAHKGLDVLLDALELARGPVELLVAGPSADVRYQEKLAHHADEARLRVQWLGAYEPADLPGLLADVDVVVAPSQVPEVFPLAVREALSHSVPVVAARQPGLVDVVVDEVNGLLFAADDAAGLARCIDRVAASGGLLDALRAGADGTAWVPQDEHVRYLLELYADVLEGQRSSEEARTALDRLHHEALRAGFAGRARLRGGVGRLIYRQTVG